MKKALSHAVLEIEMLPAMANFLNVLVVSAMLSAYIFHSHYPLRDNLQELDPPVAVLIYISNGTAVHFPIYADQSRKEYLKLECDLCGRELRLNRNSGSCCISKLFWCDL